jgi:hypothetical protein
MKEGSETAALIDGTCRAKLSTVMGTSSSSLRLGLALGLGLALCAGCGQKRSAPAARTATPPVAPPAIDTAAAEAAQAEAESKEKRPRLGEAAVYIDGKPVGVLRRQELPPKLAGHVVALGEGYTSTVYSLTEYLTALGGDPKKVRAAHLYGGSRISVVDKAEFARIGTKINFSFVGGDRGKPRIDYPPIKLNVNTTIDMLSCIAFYVEKEPPTLKDGELVMPDGTKVAEKVPYAPEEQGNGTRVYVDGQLVGTVKRKKLTNDVAVAGNDSDPITKFSLLAYAGKLNGDAKRAKSIDLVAGDDLVAHLAPDSAKDITFYVPSRNRGQALVDVPLADASAHQAARISAVQIFVNTKPPTRDVVPLDQASDATPSANAGRGQDDEP